MGLMLIQPVLGDRDGALALAVPNNIPTCGLVGGSDYLGVGGSTGSSEGVEVWRKSSVVCLVEG